MPQKFPYEKAAMAIAESDIFGDQAVIKKYGINQSTLWRWRERAAIDSDLQENATLKRRILLIDWQQDATRTIKIALSDLARRIPIATTEEDAKVIHAVAGAAKIVGELKIAYEALSDVADSCESRTFEGAAR